MNKKAIIIGAGISGLSCAIMLRKIGYEVVVYEKSGILRDGGAGLTLWPNATNALKEIGILETVYSRSKRIHDSAIISSAGAVITQIPFDQFAADYGTATIGLLRSELFAALTEQLQGIEFKTGHRCKAIRQRDNKVTAYFDNGKRDTGDLLIGADGIHSVIRSEIAGETMLRQHGITAWRGVVRMNHEYCRTGYAFECWGKGVRFGFLPVSDDMVYWFATMKNKPSLQQAVSDKEVLQRVLSSYAEPIPTVLRLTEGKDMIRSEVVDLKPLRRWVSGRVALAGDAAHASTPNLGQGACMALEDAVVLAKSLQLEQDLSDALASYAQIRMRRTRMVVNRSWFFGKFSQLESALLYNSRNLFIKAVPSKLQQVYYRSIIGYKV